MSAPQTAPRQVTFDAVTRELTRTVGVVFVGYVLSMILYGFNSFQLYVYFSTILNEDRGKRWMVGILGLLDSTSVGLMTHLIDHYMIFQFPIGLPGVDKAIGTFSADNIIAVVTIFLVQLAYLEKIRKYSNAIATLLSVLALAAVSLGVVMSVQLTRAPDFDNLNHLSHMSIIGTCQVITFVVTALTFIMLLAFEKPVSSTSKSTLSNGFDQMISVLVEKGGASTIIQAGHLIAFFAAPTDRYWILFQMVARRMFFLSLLTLYINDGARGRRDLTFPSSERRVSAVDIPTDHSKKYGRFQLGENTHIDDSSSEAPKGPQVFSISVMREVVEDFDALPKKNAQ